MGKQQETDEQRQEWNKNMFAHISFIRTIKKPCIDDPKDVDRACEEYMNSCERYSVKPTIAGLSMALGVTRNILRKWISGEVSIQTADIIINYYSVIEIFDETALKENKTNAVAGLFNMKNNYGYKDEVEIKHVDERAPTLKEIEERHKKRTAIENAGKIIDVPPREIDYTQKEEPPVEEKTPATQEMIDKGLLNDDDNIPF